MHAHRKYSREMLLRAIDKDILGGSFKIKIVIPEDIIGLKLQSSVNDPKRFSKDMSDIETLIKINRKSLNMEIVKEYFDLFNMTNELYRIIEAVDDVK